MITSDEEADWRERIGLPVLARIATFFVAFGLWAIVFSLGTTQTMLIPNWGLSFETSEDRNAMVISKIDARGSAATTSAKVGDHIITLQRVEDGAVYAVKPYSLTPNRVCAGGYEEWARVVADKRDQWNFMAADVTLRRDDGTGFRLSPNNRLGILDLGFWYWVNAALSVTVLGLATGLAVFAPASTQVRLTVAAGVCLSVALLYHAFRSTLLFAAPDLLWAGLYFGGGLSGILYTFIFLGLIWHIPSPPLRLPVASLSIAAGMFVFVAQHFSWDVFVGNPFVSPFLTVYALTLSLMLYQFIRTRSDPVANRTVSWVCLSMLGAFVPYFTLIFVPRALQIPALIPPELGAVVMIITWIGFVAATLKFRLFDISQVWFGTMIWLSVFAVFMTVDIVLVIVFGLTNLQAASFAAVVASWSLFPIKSLVLDHIARRNAISWEKVTLEFVDEIGALDNHSEIDGRMISFLQRLFSVQAVEMNPEINTRTVDIAEHGLSIRVPAITRMGSVKLTGRNQGTRLFTSSDQRALQLLYDMAWRMFDQREHQDTRRSLDRDRIARDLHDHLGSRLLSLLYSSRENTETRKAAVAAVEALKESVMVLEDVEELDIETSWAEFWPTQAVRLSEAGLDFSVESRFDVARIVDSRTYINIKYIVQELVTNILKYADPDFEIHFYIGLDENGTFRFDAENRTAADAKTVDGASAGGRGLPNIIARTTEIGAAFEALPPTLQSDGFRARLSVPLEAAEAP